MVSGLGRDQDRRAIGITLVAHKQFAHKLLSHKLLSHKLLSHKLLESLSIF